MARVEIYSKKWCAFCDRAKALLDREGIEYTEHDITTDLQGIQTMIKRADGRRSVPQIFIDDQGIGGYSELAELHQSGELRERFGGSAD
ncbi:MAG: glutaredoxin 3 [Xanthomonadales bacterium]|nr:glutaredoxin 3 [Xanthomonadales bacterium]